jgi:hypothetical protein
MARDFADRVEIRSCAEELDIPGARERARQQIQRLANAGLDGLWSKYLGDVVTYDAYFYGLSLGRESVLYDETEGGEDWLVSKQTQYRSYGMSIRVDENWSVRDGGRAHNRERSRSLRHPNEPRAIMASAYEETRLKGSSRVNRSLTIIKPGLTRQESVRDHVEVDDAYGCEPLLMEMAAAMACDPQSEPAIFTATEPYMAKTVYWILSPAEPAPLPSNLRGVPVPTVWLRFDYDPNPIRLYFDEEGVLLGHDDSEGLYYVLRVEDAEETTLRREEGS